MSGWSFLKGSSANVSSAVGTPALFCYDCYKAGKSPWLYSLNRDNFSTRNLHKKNQHKNEAPSVEFVTPRDVKARDALLKWQQWKEKSPGKSGQATKRRSFGSSVRYPIVIHAAFTVANLCSVKDERK